METVDREYRKVVERLGRLKTSTFGLLHIYNHYYNPQTATGRPESCLAATNFPMARRIGLDGWGQPMIRYRRAGNTSGTPSPASSCRAGATSGARPLARYNSSRAL